MFGMRNEEKGEEKGVSETGLSGQLLSQSIDRVRGVRLEEVTIAHSSMRSKVLNLL